MISRAELLQSRDTEYPLTPELEFNLGRLFHAVNLLRAEWGKPLIVTSGYRPGKYNTAAGGATGSAHLTCEACDLQDTTGELARWIVRDLTRLVRWGLYMEDFAHTTGWVHVQVRPTTSGMRIFLP